LLNLIVLLF